MSEIDTKRPFADWVWNPNRHKWQYPNIQLPTSKFNSEWDEVNNKWISECKVNENRLLRAFSVWKAEIKNDQSPYKAACSTTEYMIKSLPEETLDQQIQIIWLYLLKMAKLNFLLSLNIL